MLVLQITLAMTFIILYHLHTMRFSLSSYSTQWFSSVCPEHCGSSLFWVRYKTTISQTKTGHCDSVILTPLMYILDTSFDRLNVKP